MDSPDACLIQVSIRVHPSLGGCDTKLPLGMTSMVGGQLLSPGVYGLGFASGDTNPTLFGTTDTCLALVFGGCIQS